MAEILIPDPSLVVLVGAAGSGKSTFAARHFATDVVLSSDRYRAIVSGDEANQSATRSAFGRLHRDLGRRLAAGLLTVVDATSIEPFARRALVARARAAGVVAIALVLDLPEPTVLARNAGRPRRVDEAVVGRQLARLRQSIDGPDAPIRREGFAAVIVLHQPTEIDELTVRRVPA